MKLTISALQSGGLITNYYCSSACRHCLYRCSPKWPKDYITLTTAGINLETIRRLGCRSIHIGGGEPLLQPDRLTGVLEAAGKTGVSVEYVETNSSWFRNHGEACRILEMLAKAGLQTLLVSISPFHNEFIPFYKVKGVLEACRRVGIAVFPWVSGFIDDLNAFDGSTTHALEEYEQRFGETYCRTLPQRYWISPGGRALELLRRFAPQKPVEQILATNRNRCAELAEVSHFHLDLYGHYIPGLCAGLSISREDLGAPLDPEEYPILSRLSTGGIGAFWQYAAEQYGFQPSRPGYSSKCELCYDIRRFLVQEKGIHSKELQPQEHYLL